MKNLSLLVVVYVFLLPTIIDGQIFSQDFSSSSTLSDYISSTPNSGQFNNITATSGSVVSISNNALVLTRTSGGMSRFNRSTDLTSNTINGIIFIFNLSVSENSSASTSAARLFIGSNVGNNATTPSNTDYYARLAINFDALPGRFALRDMESGTNSSTFSGIQLVTWVINNTGSTLTYTAPDASTENVGNDKIDIWVGTIRVFNEINPINVPTFVGNLSQFKGVLDGGIGAMIFDNINISGGNNALPVELTSFTGTANESGVQLNWTTATEVNNYGFEVECRIENDEWQIIGFVHGNGNSNSPKYYSFMDENIPAGKVTYRLKQIDFDGKFEYSDVVNVYVAAPESFSVKQNFPNPFNPITTIKYLLPSNAFVTIKVFDVIGREVVTLLNANETTGVHQINFDGKDFPSGVYFYKVQAGGYSQFKKMLLIK